MTSVDDIQGNVQSHLLIDKKKCQGCMTCMLACSLVHDGKENLSKSKIRVIQSSFEKYPNDIEVHLLESCDLCLDAPFWKEQGGINGKQACVEVCPLGAVRFFKEITSSIDNDKDEIRTGSLFISWIL